MRIPNSALAAGVMAAALSLVVPGSALAQTPTPTPAAAPSTPPPPIDTAVIGTLNRMGAYLQTLTAFQIHAETTTDKVMADGEKVQLMSTVDLVAERPSRLRLTQTNDRTDRQFIYDGMWLTLWAPRLKYW